VDVAGRDADEERQSVRVRQDVHLGPGFPWSTGLGPVCPSPFFGPDVGGVEDDAGDVDEAGVVELVQHGLVQPAPATRLWTI
jgi:hypothetical protein